MNLKRTLVIDNSIINYMCCVANGVPILPYDGSPEDTELLKLAKYLVSVSGLENIAEFNGQYFDLVRYKACRSVEEAYVKLFKP